MLHDIVLLFTQKTISEPNITNLDTHAPYRSCPEKIYTKNKLEEKLASGAHNIVKEMVAKLHLFRLSYL